MRDPRAQPPCSKLARAPSRGAPPSRELKPRRPGRAPWWPGAGDAPALGWPSLQVTFPGLGTGPGTQLRRPAGVRGTSTAHVLGDFVPELGSLGSLGSRGVRRLKGGWVARGGPPQERESPPEPGAAAAASRPPSHTLPGTAPGTHPQPDAASRSACSGGRGLSVWRCGGGLQPQTVASCPCSAPGWLCNLGLPPHLSGPVSFFHVFEASPPLEPRVPAPFTHLRLQQRVPSPSHTTRFPSAPGHLDGIRHLAR